MSRIEVPENPREEDGRPNDVCHPERYCALQVPYLHSPKNKAAVEKLAKIAGIDPMKFGMELLKAKSDISTKSAKDILTGDFKKFDFLAPKRAWAR